MYLPVVLAKFTLSRVVIKCLNCMASGVLNNNVRWALWDDVQSNECVPPDCTDTESEPVFEHLVSSGLKKVERHWFINDITSIGDNNKLAIYTR